MKRLVIVFAALSATLLSCGEEPLGEERPAEEPSAADGGPVVATRGALSLTPPSRLWHIDDELSSMLTLKRGEAAPTAVARFYTNGRDSRDEERLRKRPGELAEFFQEMARGLRDQIELAAGADAEFISGPDYREEPYLAASYAYRSRLGSDLYYNLDTVFYVGGRYAFLDISCYAGEEEGLAAEFAALVDSARIELGEPVLRKLEPGQELTFEKISLVVPGQGFSAEESGGEMVLLKDGRPLVNIYRRRPALGGAEGSDLAGGLKGEIEALYGEVEYLGPVEVRRSRGLYGAVSYRGSVSGRPVWRRDAAIALDGDYYFIDAGCPADSPEALKEQLAELVDSVGPREEK
ncbi:MAG TPA: hypothetical protein ENN88_02225 [Candidatus Coatesbacteria bacterium]|nr:hypothetical protein [Candidatus Coatesbacteria bacterium]